MSRKPKTIVDVTQLVHWPGELTGIPRVMNELTVRFRRLNDPSTIFASWVKELQTFCEVDIDATLAGRGRGIVYRRAGEVGGDLAESSVEPDAPYSLDIGKSMQLLRKSAIKAVKLGLKGAAKVSPRMARSVEERAKAIRMSRYKRVDFKQGDILFIPWGEWWDSHFIDKLEQWQEMGVKIAHIMHDMTPIVVPQFSGHSTDTFPIYAKRIFPICAQILSVSESSKRDCTQWLKDNNLPVPPIKVFRLGDNFKFSKPIKPTDPHFVSSGLNGDDFLLCVGTLEARKNHTLLYYVYKLAKAKGISLPKMVLVGRKGWGTDDIFNFITQDPEVKDQFVPMLNTDDQSLAWLYEHCKFTVQPSLYEGWGIPIAESVARGIPCLCSNSSSMVEIAPGMVDHFTPASTDECLAGIQALLEPGHFQEAVRRAKKYKPFTWEQSFAQVRTYLEELK